MPWENEDHHVLRSVAENLEHLATAARISLFYSETERQDLASQYRDLARACVEARARVQEADPKDGLSWEDRVMTYGENEANRVIQPVTAARVALNHAVRAFDAFGKNYPLIGKLLAGTIPA